MAIDARLPLLGQTPDFSQIPNTLLNTAAGVQNLRNNQAILQLRQQEAEQIAAERPLQMEAMKQRVESGRLQNTSAKQQQLNEEQKSVIQGSYALKQFLDRGDMAGAREFALQRKAAAESLGLNTSHTDRALELLETDPAQLQAFVDGNVQLGYQTGVLEAPKQKDLTGLIGKATPESIARFQQSGNYADLQEVQETLSPEAAARLAIDQQRLGLDQQRLGLQAAQLQDSASTRAAAEETRRLTAETRQQQAESVKAGKESAKNQELISLQGVLADIDRAEKLLKTGKNITGPLIGKTPNLSQEAQELESLTQALGIGRLTEFKGATSEKELAAALRSGLSMQADSKPNLNRLAAQRKIVEANIKRLGGTTQAAPSIDDLLKKYGG